MIKAMIQEKIDKLFGELESITSKVVTTELKKQKTTSITEMTKESLGAEDMKRLMVISMQLQMLSNIEGAKKC